MFYLGSRALVLALEDIVLSTVIVPALTQSKFSAERQLLLNSLTIDNIASGWYRIVKKTMEMHY